MSMPDIAKSTMLCTPSNAYLARSFLSMSNGATASPLSISAIASTSLAIAGRCCLPGLNRYERPTIPPSVCRSINSSGATVTAAMLVCSGRFIGTATARTRTDSIFSFICPPLFSLEARLALLHERAPAFLVVLALGAALHRCAHGGGIGRALRFHEFFDDGLRVGDGERRIRRKRLQD